MLEFCKRKKGGTDKGRIEKDDVGQVGAEFVVGRATGATEAAAEKVDKKEGFSNKMWITNSFDKATSRKATTFSTSPLRS